MGQSKESDSKESNKIRLDKWLWAARFYKTRSIAKEMIDGGKVHYEGQRVKASKEVSLGAEIRLRQGFEEKTIVVLQLSGRRGNATSAAALYEETPESIEKRQLATAQRKAMNAAAPGSDNRPNKKQRRQIIQFRHQQSE